MGESPIMLSSLLANMRGAIDEIVADGARGHPETTAIDNALGSLADAVDDGVRQACDCDLVGLLVEGWSKASELRGYGDKAKYPPPSKTRMTLGKHDMKVAIDPELTIVVGRVVRFPLEFIVEFVATVNAARLTIIDGGIDAVDLGSLTIAAKLRWGTAVVPLPLKTREIALPGHFDIKPRRLLPGL